MNYPSVGQVAGYAVDETIEAPLDGKLPIYSREIAGITERLLHIDEMVNGLLTRCHGPVPTPVRSGGEDTAKPPSHFAEMEQRLTYLNEVVGRLTERACALNSIG